MPGGWRKLTARTIKFYWLLRILVIMPHKNMEQRLIELRQRAQRQMGTEPSESLAFVPEEVLHLLEELHIHQVELEIQNEDLRRVQQQLETTHEAYRALYEFARSEEHTS